MCMMNTKTQDFQIGEGVDLILRSTIGHTIDTFFPHLRYKIAVYWIMVDKKMFVAHQALYNQQYHTVHNTLFL